MRDQNPSAEPLSLEERRKAHELYDVVRAKVAALLGEPGTPRSFCAAFSRAGLLAEAPRRERGPANGGVEGL